jgi:uncharacterized protein YjbJ (UPF0337 family)
MNWDQAAGNWKQWTGQLKTKWGKLTDDDLMMISGRREQLAGLLQTKYGLKKEEAELQVDKFAETLTP